jgi:hypothetical protein
MKEEFLHAVWKNSLYEQPLKTLFGESVEVLSKGILNRDSGPDFSMAKIRIGDTVWAGAVEIHVRSSQWYVHNHEVDLAYDNVILHVVWEEDRPVYDKYGVHIPTVELKNQVKPGAIINFDRLELSDKKIPCSGRTSDIRLLTRMSWQERMVIERLENRREMHLKWLREMNGQWDGVLFRALARGMGFGINSEAMEVLSKSLDFDKIRRLRDQKSLIALFLGAAGFLDVENADSYTLELQKEWDFRKKQFSMTQIIRAPWKFSKMRPGNTPVIRLVQFAQLLASRDILNRAEEYLTVDGGKLLANFEAPEYWKNHHRPGVESVKSFGNFTQRSAENLLINAIAPVIFTKSIQEQNQALSQKVLDFLRSLPPENNRITRIYTEDGWENNSALDSQAFVQMNRNYCLPKKCLSCSIGVELLKSED